MKKIFIVMSLLAITVALFGCGKTDNSSSTSNVIPPQEYNKTFTLQGKIMDAVTGAPVGNDPNDSAAVLKVYLIQGDLDRGPTKLHTSPSDPLVGEYSISGIPASIAAGDAVLYKVVVYRKGYQNFEANVQYNATDTGNTIEIDGVLNMIGNIYLFPLGTLAGDQNIYVYDHGLPLPNAQILVEQSVTNNTTAAIIGNRLAPSAGLYTSMTATTDSNGLATISGTKLVLGGAYHVIVAEMTFMGEILSEGTDTFVVSTANPNVVIDMTNHAGVATLFATSASNQVPGTIAASGVLSITLNQPITTSPTLTCTATMAGGAGNGLLTLGTTTTNASAAYAAGLDSTGTIITLTPIITAGTVTTPGATLTWSCAATTLHLKSTQAGSATLLNAPGTDITNINTGAAISGAVQLLAY